MLMLRVGGNHYGLGFIGLDLRVWRLGFRGLGLKGLRV